MPLFLPTQCLPQGDLTYVLNVEGDPRPVAQNLLRNAHAERSFLHILSFPYTDNLFRVFKLCVRFLRFLVQVCPHPTSPRSSSSAVVQPSRSWSSLHGRMCHRVIHTLRGSQACVHLYPRCARSFARSHFAQSSSVVALPRSPTSFSLLSVPGSAAPCAGRFQDNVDNQRLLRPHIAQLQGLLAISTNLGVAEVLRILLSQDFLLVSEAPESEVLAACELLLKVGLMPQSERRAAPRGRGEGGRARGRRLDRQGIGAKYKSNHLVSGSSKIP